MLKENIRNSYLTAFETVKAFVENEENIEKTEKNRLLQEMVEVTVMQCTLLKNLQEDLEKTEKHCHL